MTGSWTDETVPTQRVADEYSPEQEGPPRPPAIPAFVWGLGCATALVVAAVAGLWGLTLFRGQIPVGGPTPTPIIWTPTPAPIPTATPTATPEPLPTTSPDITIGRYVRVTGTGGYGLSLRDGPGETYARMDVALEGEVFVAIEGPQVAGDSQWWKIRDPENEARAWWAVGNFLEPTDHP